jgi:predicted ATP-binding protein involved in virulence
MKIEITSLRLVNCGPFDDVTIDFSDGNGRGSKTILLAGANGSGKTTVLETIERIFESMFSNKPYTGKAERIECDFSIQGATVANEYSNDTFIADIHSHYLYDAKINSSTHHHHTKQTWLKASESTAFSDSSSDTYSAIENTVENQKGKDAVNSNAWLTTKGGFRGSVTGKNPLRLIFSEERIIDFEPSDIVLRTSENIPSSVLYIPHIRQLLVSEGQFIEKEEIKYTPIFRYRDAIEFPGSLASYLIWLEYLKDESDEYEKTITFLNSLNIDGKKFGVIRRKLQAITILPDGTEHPIAQMSSGEQNLFIILLELRRRLTKGSIVMIDEVEDSLHSTYQRKLMWALKKLQEEFDLQLIIASHSEDVVEAVGSKSVRILTNFRK